MSRKQLWPWTLLFRTYHHRFPSLVSRLLLVAPAGIFPVPAKTGSFFSLIFAWGVPMFQLRSLGGSVSIMHLLCCCCCCYVVAHLQCMSCEYQVFYPALVNTGWNASLRGVVFIACRFGVWLFTSLCWATGNLSTKVQYWYQVQACQNCIADHIVPKYFEFTMHSSTWNRPAWRK